MRNALILLFLGCLSTSTFAQAWTDSLVAARKAYKNKEYQKANSLYKSAQNSAPKEVDLTQEIAQSAYRSQNYQEADTYYQQAADLSKDPKEKAKLQHNSGNARMKQKDYEGAISAYKESLRNNPNDDETRYNLSEAIRQKKEQEKKDQQNNDDNQSNNNDKNEKNENKNSSGNKKNNNSSNGNKNQSSSLPNRQADKMLDDLAKKEAETRKKMGSNKGKKSTTSSGKNW